MSGDTTPAPEVKLLDRNPAAGRQSARGILESRIREHKRDIESLEELLRNIPEDISPERDGLLWSIFLKL